MISYKIIYLMDLQKVADRGWMYREPQHWETFLSKVSGFLAKAHLRADFVRQDELSF